MFDDDDDDDDSNDNKSAENAERNQKPFDIQPVHVVHQLKAATPSSQ